MRDGLGGIAGKPLALGLQMDIQSPRHDPIPELDVASPQNRKEQIEKLISAGNYTDCVELLRESLEEQPKNINYRLTLGQILHNVFNEHEEALKEFNTILTYNPSHKLAKLSILHVLCKTAPSEALSEVDKLLTVNQYDLDYTMFKINVLLLLHRYTEAALLIMPISRTMPQKSLKLADGLLSSAVAAGSFSEAVQIARDFIAAGIRSSSINLVLASALMQVGHLNEALKKLDEVPWTQKNHQQIISLKSQLINHLIEVKDYKSAASLVAEIKFKGANAEIIESYEYFFNQNDIAVPGFLRTQTSLFIKEVMTLASTALGRLDPSRFSQKT